MKTLIFLLLSLPVAVFAEGGLPNQPYIYVEGNAEIEKPADMVTMSFAVVARAPDQPKANEQVQTTANKVFALLKERKIADNDIVAESLQSETQFENEDNYQKRGKVIGYTVTRPFNVKVRDVDEYPTLINELIAIGAEFSGVDGGLQREKALQDEMWSKALTNARELAAKTVKQAGMKIDSVFAISPAAFLAIQGRIFTEEGMPYARRHNIPTAEEVGPPQYKVGAVEVTQTVHVIYLISPAK